MKKIVLLSFSFATLYANAQNVKLETGKIFKITTTINASGEMMSMENKSDVMIVTEIKITGADEKSYKATATVKKMTMTGNGMGQDFVFDSDKKEDMESQIGQMVGGNIKKDVAITIDKATGNQEELEKSEANGMAAIMGGGAKSENIFFALPKDKKQGDKWSEVSDNDGIKNTKNYELQTLNGNTATILVTNVTTGNTTKEMGGNSVDMTIDSKGTGSFVVDVNTGIIKQSKNEIDSNTNMEAGGQSMVTSSKSKSTMVVE